MTRSKEQVLEALLALVPDLVVLLDPEGRITMFNNACESLTGYHRDEVLGRELLGFLVPEPWWPIVRQRFTDPFAPETRRPHENPWLTKSGEERLISWRCTALKVPDSVQPYILGIGTDVTEQRRLEEKARAQARLLERFFESTLTCIALLDRDFNFIRVNQAYASTGRRDAAEFPGLNHFDLYPSDARPIFKEVIRGRKPYIARSHPFEYPDQPERGVTYWDWNLVPVLDEHGEVEFLLFCLNEVTEHRRGEMKLQEAMEQLHGLSRQMVDIQEQERRRIARELHDEIGQDLTALRLALENMLGECNERTSTRMREALATTADLIQGVRRIALDLRPPMLDDLGLLSALLWLFDRHRAQTGLDVRFKHKGLDARLSPEIETAVFRIVQEALTNIIRHSGVTEAEVALWVTDEAVLLRIEDKGCGFDHIAGELGQGAGLLGMQERCTLLGGMLTVDSASNAGTTITADFPRGVPDKPDDEALA